MTTSQYGLVHAVLLSTALFATLEGSSCPRQRQDTSFPLSSRARSFLNTGPVSEMCSSVPGRGAGGSLLGRSRSLNGVDTQYLLRGNVMQLANWTCKEQCLPQHEKVAAAPGLDKLDKCTESRQVGALELQDDIDLKCLGEHSTHNLTCDDIENNATWKNWRQDLYSNCDQDRDLLNAECKLMCRFTMHPTKRCTYQFDRLKKYGMHGDSGMYGFHHCILLKVCQKEPSTTEDNALFCNITETHPILFSSTVTTTSALNTAPPVTTTTATKEVVLIVQAAAASEEGGSVLMGALLGGGAVGIVAIMGSVGYFKVRQFRGAASSSNAQNGVVRAPDDGSTVVVGRPVMGVAPPAGETANPGNDKGNEKGDKEVP